MKEVYGNIWQLPGDAICITTNGCVKDNGEAVMGKGIAKEAKTLVPTLSKELGARIKESGNHVYVFGGARLDWSSKKVSDIVAFPTKHNWWEMSDMELIRRSCRELIEKADYHGWKNVLLPRPGCGNGRLQWEDVKREIEPILDDRISIITFYKS